MTGVPMTEHEDDYNSPSIETSAPSRRWKLKRPGGGAAAGASGSDTAAGPELASAEPGATLPSGGGPSTLDGPPVGLPAVRPHSKRGSAVSYEVEYDSPNSSVREKVQHFETALSSSQPASPSATRHSSYNHSRASSAGGQASSRAYDGAAVGYQSAGAAATAGLAGDGYMPYMSANGLANGMPQRISTSAGDGSGGAPPYPPAAENAGEVAVPASLPEEVERLRRENLEWKKRMEQVTKENNNVAVDNLVSVLLDQNAELMERCGALHVQNEALRQRSERSAVAEARAAESEILGPSTSRGVDGEVAEQLRRLTEENELLRRGIGDRSAVLDKVDLTALPEDVALEFVMLMTEVEDLKAKVGELFEEKTAAINEENIALINELTDENVRLEEEVATIRAQLNAGAAGDSEAKTRLEAMEGEVKRMVEEKQKFMDANRKLSERNSRLLQDNDVLTEKLAAATAAGTADSSHAAQQQQQEDEHMGLVHELTAEHSALLDETKMLSKRVNDLLQMNENLIRQNQHLNDRLIQAALGGLDDEPVPPTPMGADDDQQLRAMYRQLEEQVRKDEAAQKEAYERRLKLQAKGMRAVEAAKQRQEAQARASAGEAPAEDPAVVAAREAKKREERELARLALQTRLAEGRKKREEEVARKQQEAVARMREQELARQREEALLNQYKKDAAEKVKKSYFQAAGSEDVGAFMRSLGFTFEAELSANPSDDELRDVFKRAIVATHPDRHVNAPLQQRALAEATYTKLQSWMKELSLA